MAIYRIHRMKESTRQNFRWGAHTAGVAAVKPKDYEEAGHVDAPHAYGAWAALRETEQALLVGDLLEDESGALRIFKYVGFEDARWILPEVKTGLEGSPLAAGGSPDRRFEGPAAGR
ncbi:MAG: hypothetical protein R2762_00440 [Bryobacteraceae bacterium]